MGHSFKTEHAGAKNSSASNGFWGRREEAKRRSRERRRMDDKQQEREYFKADQAVMTLPDGVEFKYQDVGYDPAFLKDADVTVYHGPHHPISFTASVEFNSSGKAWDRMFDQLATFHEPEPRRSELRRLLRRERYRGGRKARRALLRLRQMGWR